MLFQTYVLIHQRAGQFREIIILVQSETSTSESVILRLSNQMGLQILNDWSSARKSAAETRWKVVQNMQKNLLFQTYVLIHQRATQFREMIILVQNE